MLTRPRAPADLSHAPQDATKGTGCRNLWFAELPAPGDAFPPLSASVAAQQLADYESIPEVAKRMARMGHALSATYTAFQLPRFRHLGPFRLDASRGVDERPPAPARGPADIIVVDVPDVPARNPDGSESVDPAGEPRIMTDGCGKISLNLARLIPAVYGGALEGGGSSEGAAGGSGGDGGAPRGAAALIQVRVYANGCLYKGTLLVCASLPDNELHMPKSMKKARHGPRRVAVWLSRLRAPHGVC